MMLNMNRIGRKTKWWVFCTAVFLIASFSPGVMAGTTAKGGTETIASSTTVSADKIVFDGEGVLDSIDPYIIDPKAENTNFAASLLVVIDGRGEQFSDDIRLYHYLNQDVGSDDLKAGIFVGFKRDPSDKISELWLLEENPKKESIEKQSVSKNIQPSSADETIINKDGVWKN